jgi:ATP-dependent Clp protease ATP-binding subunit ClpB
MQAVRAHFRPEFLNRLDEIILFHRLTRANMDKIVDIQIGRLQKLLADRKIAISLDDKARHWLGNAGYDPVYGARPLKRVIQRRLQDPLAHLILEGGITDGAQVTVSASKTGLTINGKEFAAGIDELVDAAPAGTALN